MKTEQERRETKLFRELRKENIRLKRQLKEMKREMNLVQSLVEDEEGEGDLIEVPQIVEKHERFSCPSCGGYGAMPFQLMGRDYYKCLDCGSKGKKTS